MRISGKPLNLSVFEWFWKPNCPRLPTSSILPTRGSMISLSRDVWCLEAFFPKSKFEPVRPRLKVQNVWSKLSRVPMPQNIQWKTWRHSLEIATKSVEACVSVHLIFEQHVLDTFALPGATMYLFDTLAPALFDDSLLLAWKRCALLYFKEPIRHLLHYCYLSKNGLENKKLKLLAKACC